MTEKDLDSMATVQMKPEYAPSEVYSTASEPPPAYKRKTSSVQIAKIVAFTVIVSSFIIGSFILASAYLQAKASCDQIQALDSVLEKELMLETLQQELPRAEALLGKENDDGIDLQNLDESIKKDKETKLETSDNNKNDKDETETDSSFSDSDETDDLQKVQMKVPLELDLSDLAAALLQNNQKSRMNCVIERKHAEEYVDTPSKTVNLPFGVNLSTDPKRAKITGERISIFCDGGDSHERNNNNNDDDAEQIRPMLIPIQHMPIPYGPMPQQVPLTHMPQRMMPLPQYQSQMFNKMAPPPPFQQMPQQHMQPPQIMQTPHHPEPHLRIQVQRIPVREIRIPSQNFQQLPFPIRDIASSVSSQQQSQSNEVPSSEMHPQFHVQRVPLGEALQRAGITADDLRNIQRMAEDRITDELRRLAAEEAGANTSESDNSQHNNNSSEMEDDSDASSHSGEQQQQQPQQLLLQQRSPQQPDETMRPPMPDQPQILQIGRSSYGRSLLTPVRIPVPMMQALADELSRDETSESERPHYVHPRSVRSVENPFKPAEKRVKRFACNCDC